ASTSAALVLVGAALVAAPTLSVAQTKKTSKPAGPSLSTQIAQQKRRIDEQQDLIERQRQAFDTLRAAADSQTVIIAAQAARVAPLDSQLVTMKGRLEALESQANFPAWEDTLEERIRKVEAATQKSPELPPDIVSAGDFPGSIRIPGSDAAIKFGARIR